MSRRLLACFAFVATSAVATPALSWPTLWERAREPNARAEAKLLATLERMLDDAGRDGVVEAGLGREFARAAVAMIELTGLDDPRDPRLSCMVADALVEADIGREREARRLLEGALAELPPGARAAFAWYSLAITLARLDDARAEREAWTRVLELGVSPLQRANAFYNRGEVEMRERDLPAALADYERAVALAREPALVALSRYGLAVATERLGDLPVAFAALDKADAVTLPVPLYASEDPLDLPGVFFVPAYEEHYLRALRAMSRARRSAGADERRANLETAVVEWELFLTLAPDNEQFRENAERHRARAERELLAGSR